MIKANPTHVTWGFNGENADATAFNPDTFEYWLLCVDGGPNQSMNGADYHGAGDYAWDLSKMNPPIDPGTYNLSVAMVCRNGSISGQSPAVAVTFVDDSPVEAPTMPVEQIAPLAPIAALTHSSAEYAASFDGVVAAGQAVGPQGQVLTPQPNTPAVLAATVEAAPTDANGSPVDPAAAATGSTVVPAGN